jgi:PPOX class probable F420-dependent enzyme
MARALSVDEIRVFLMAGTHTGKLAVVRADGSPLVVPIWFVLDGDDIIFMTGAGSVKGKSLRRDGRVSICVDEEAPPYAFVRVDGTVTIDTDLERMLPWSTAIGGRYMGADRAEEFGRRNAVDGELLVRVTPTRIVGHGDVAG